jgi:hypothetical protein
MTGYIRDLYFKPVSRRYLDLPLELDHDSPRLLCQACGNGRVVEAGLYFGCRVAGL